MKGKDKKRAESLTGRNARRIDLDAWIDAERRRSVTFREAFEEARRATEIARELARVRRERGVSQAEMARRLRTSQQAVSRLERPDYQGHTVRMLVRYAESLGKELRFVLSEPSTAYTTRVTPRLKAPASRRRRVS